MKIIKIVLFSLYYILVMIIMYGCVPQVKGAAIAINNQTFDTAEEALNYQKALYKKELKDGIPPTKTPVGGKVCLILPKEDYYKDIIYKLNPNKREEGKKFLVQSVLFSDQAFYKELGARNIFDEVVLKTSDDPEKDALTIKDMVVVYRSAKLGFVQNFVRRKNGEVVAIPYNVVFKKMPLENKIDILDKIEKAAK